MASIVVEKQQVGEGNALLSELPALGMVHSGAQHFD
jgi:hypothetical protein